MILILGFGIVGKAAYAYFKDNCVVWCDEHIDGIRLFDNDWSKIECVVASAGFSPNHKMIRQAKKRKIPVKIDIEVFLDNLDHGKIIAVTGTNGKSTFCTFLKQALGDRAVIGGNFGISPLSFDKKYDYYILELSNYQLQFLNKEVISKFEIGVLLNVFRHHLDRHKTFKKYKDVKKKILHARNSFYEYCVKNIEAEGLPENGIFKNDVYIRHYSVLTKILPYLGLNEAQVKESFKNYTGLKYRQEKIAHGVINDSKATNSEAAFKACSGMREDFLWISQMKVPDERILNLPHMKKFSIFGNDVGFNHPKLELIEDNFENLIKHSLDYARKHNLVILFSPGATSFEFFQNFEARGDVFEKLVKQYMI
jgi:UDP-N-acetylmuramoylalanine--D-glutamate ligase